MKLNVWQIAATVIGIVLAFIVVEEIKKRRARKAGALVNGAGASVGGELAVAGTPVIAGEVDVNAGGVSRTMYY